MLHVVVAHSFPRPQLVVRNVSIKPHVTRPDIPCLGLQYSSRFVFFLLCLFISHHMSLDSQGKKL